MIARVFTAFVAVVAAVIAVAAAGGDPLRLQNAASGTPRFAIVKSTGQPYKYNGMKAVDHPADGFYVVRFKKSVKGCAAVATAGGTEGEPGLPDPTIVGVYTASKRVRVSTYNTLSGAHEDTPFHLALACG